MQLRDHRKPVLDCDDWGSHGVMEGIVRRSGTMDSEPAVAPGEPTYSDDILLNMPAVATE